MCPKESAESHRGRGGDGRGTQHQILWLDVPVGDVDGVHLTQRDCHLHAIKLRDAVFELLVPPEMREELPALHKLQQQIEIVVILEEGIPGAREGGGM